MRKSVLKRTLAGILAASTMMTVTPMYALTVAAEDVDSASNIGALNSSSKAWLDWLKYFNELGDDYGLPPIMISEGDKVSIGGLTVATTVVPMTKELVGKQNKIRSEYWLDTLQIGDYDTLVAKSDQLKAYFEPEMSAYKEYNTEMRELLIQLRDYCISKKLTQKDIWARIDCLYNAEKKDANSVTEQIDNLILTYNAEHTETPVNLYLRSEDFGDLSAEELPAYDDVRSVITSDPDATVNTALCKAYGLTGIYNGCKQQFSTLNDTLYDVAHSMSLLVGDVTVDSATYIDEQLKTTAPEDLLYAYVGVYANLYTVVQKYDSVYYNVYVPINADMLSTAFVVSLSDAEVYITDTADEALYYITQESYDVMQQVATLLQDNVSNIHDEYTDILNGFANLIDSVYVFENLGTDEVKFTASGCISAKETKEASIIKNIPADLKDTWGILYDSRLGINAIEYPFAVETFESSIDKKQSVMNGAWDFNSTIYDAVKYVDTRERVGDNYVTVKKALTDENGNEKHYGKQSEVTPWIAMNDLCSHDDYLNIAAYDLVRNNIGSEYDSYNPQHPVQYDKTNSEDLVALLVNSGYNQQIAEDMVFNLKGVNVQVNRYAIDSFGSDCSNLLNYTVETTDTENLQYIDVFSIYDSIKATEYATVDSAVIDSFKTFLKTRGIDEETNAEALEAYTEVYLADMTGFNKHNGYGITLTFLYDTDSGIQDYTSILDVSSNRKIMLTEIPEYALSEYYEDNADMFVADKVVSDDVKNDNRLKEQLEFLELLKQNPDKLLDYDDRFPLAVSRDSTLTWDFLLNTYTKNKTLSALSGVYTVPEGTSLRLPAYVPVNGRTFDTRYFTKYIPYDRGTELPNATETQYYATAYTNKGPLDSIAAFTNITGESANGFVPLPITADLRKKMTVLYAQDRGSTLYRAMQRLLSPIEQYTVVGDSAYNMNKKLTVNEVSGGLTGYTEKDFAVAVANEGLPNLVWNGNVGDIYNLKTNEHTYTGDVHLWLAKTTAQDGVRIADWVNATPTELRDALDATNTLTGVYQNSNNVTSTEKKTRVHTGDKIVINPGFTEGTYTTWAFERKLEKCTDLAYCDKCQKVVLPEAHQVLHTCTYQIVGEWKLQWGSNSQLNTGGTSANGVNTNLYFVNPQTDPCLNVRNQQAMGSYNGHTKYDDIITDMRGGAWNGKQHDAQITGQKNGIVEIVGTTKDDCKNLLKEAIANGTITKENANQVDMVYPGKNTEANPKGNQAAWTVSYKEGELDKLFDENSTTDPDPDPEPPVPRPNPGPPPPEWHYVEYVAVIPEDVKICDGTLWPVAVWTLGNFGTSDFADDKGLARGAITNFNSEVVYPVFSDTDTTSGNVNGNTIPNVDTESVVKVKNTANVAKDSLLIDFYYHGIPEERNILGESTLTFTNGVLTDGLVTEGTYQLGVSAQFPAGMFGYTCNIQLPTRIDPMPEEVKFASEYGWDSGYGHGISYSARKAVENGTSTSLKTLQDFGYFEQMHLQNSAVPSVNPTSWGVVSSETAVAAVVTLCDLDSVYNIAKSDKHANEQAYADLIAYSQNNSKKTSTLGSDSNELTAYVESLFGSEQDSVQDAPQNITDISSIDSTMAGTTAEMAQIFYNVAGDVDTGSLNAMIINLQGSRSTQEETEENKPVEYYTPMLLSKLTDDANNTEQEEYTETDTTEVEENSENEVYTTTVATPKLTYLPYTIINNVHGITKAGTHLIYDYAEYVNLVHTDILGKDLQNEYRSEVHATAFDAYIVPEVLMTYKTHFLDALGVLKEYAERGKVETVYIAGYNEYKMDLPSYSRTSLHCNIKPEDIKFTGTMIAESKAAKALSSIIDVIYTGSDVNVTIESTEVPKVEYHSYVVDFASANVGRAWNENYTADTAKQLAQDYVDSYKNADGSFEYNVTLTNTFGKTALYDNSSNAVTSDKHSTIAVDGRLMEPLTATETYTFDITNSIGEKNTTEQIAEYAVEIRNGRLASIKADGAIYNLYGNGDITTTAQLVESTGFKKLQAANYELAEAVAHLELPEFASTLTHNAGNQTWRSYDATGIFRDNRNGESQLGKSVVDAVKDVKGVYDSTFTGDENWYAEDITTLVIREYKLQGAIEDDYAFSYKVPIDYGYKSPRNKKDLFKAGTALYAYNELYFEFLNTAEVTKGTYTGASSGTFDVVGDEGTGFCVQKPEIGYIISNATVDDMYAR